MKIELDDTLSGRDLSKINSNFQEIENALNNNVLWRDNPEGEPNQMENLLDMNGQRIINLPPPASPNDAARLQDVLNGVVGLYPASAIPFSPVPTIIATNVQDAIAELALDYQAADSLIRSDLANTSNTSLGDALIGTKATGASTVGRTQHSKNNDFKCIFDWFTDAEIADVRAGTKLINVLPKIVLACSEAKSILFPEGYYYCGSASSTSLVSFVGRGDGITLASVGRVVFECTATAGIVNFFFFQNNNHVHVSRFEFYDPTYNPGPTDNGLGIRGVVLENTGALSFSDYYIDVVGRQINSPLTTGSALPRTGAIRDIRGRIIADSCYYGYDANNDGNNVNLNIAARNCYRPFFVYGVDDVEATINNRENKSTTGAINISRSVSGPATTDIRVKYHSRGCLFNIPHVLINHIDLLGGRIDNVKIELDIEQPGLYTPVKIVNYTGVGGAESATATNNIVNNVKISGKCDAQAQAITTTGTYNTAGLIEVDISQFLYYNNALALQFAFGTEFFASGNSLWTAPTPPNIGDGTLERYTYILPEGMVKETFLLQAGPSTTMGVGEISFNLSYKTKRTEEGPAVVRDASPTAFYTGTARVSPSGAGNVALVAISTSPASSTHFSGTMPITFVNQDRLEFTVTYPSGR